MFPRSANLFFVSGILEPNLLSQIFRKSSLCPGSFLYKYNSVNVLYRETVADCSKDYKERDIIPYPTAFPYGNGMVLHFYQQQESSTTKTVHKVINKGLKTYV